MNLKKTGAATAGLALSGLALAAGTAFAAAAPTVTLGSATEVHSTSALLNATIDPNDVKTTYHFSYGPTATLGDNSAQKTVSGTRATKVATRLTGLQSGTTYYYSVQATNPDGTVTTHVRKFKTTGAPPPAVTTGPAIINSPTSVTLTGSINTNDAATSYYFEYGTTTAFGSQQQVSTIKASGSQQAVSVTLSGLAPNTTFYYNLVASHGGANTTTGTTGSLFTPPITPPRPPVGASTTPSSEHGSAFTFSTTGHITNHTSAPTVDACYGTVTIAFDHGHKRVYAQTVPLSTSCTFSATSAFAHLPVRLPRGIRAEHLTVYARFNGNYYLGVHQAKPQTVTLS
jgi:phosphodiesterase/alkaline phosphatase D-like protein